MSPAQQGDLAAQVQHLAAKQGDQGSVLQSIQAEISHMSKGMDRLVAVGERQVEMAGEMNRHSDSLKRAFRTMDDNKTNLTDAIDRLADSLKIDRDEAKKTRETVVAFESGVKTLKWVWGGVAALLIAIGTMYASNVSRELDRAERERGAIATRHNTDLSAIGIRLDAISQQVQELRLDRQREQAEKPQ
jgi:septation ring formation regulator EzrA